MSTYKEGCENVIDELGIGGGADTFPGVAAATGEMKRIVRFYKQADEYIQNLFIDWRFLWFDYSETLPINTSEFPAAMSINQVVPLPRHWVRNTLWLDRGKANPIKLTHVQWDDWRDSFRSNVIQTQLPSFYAIRPDRVIELDVKSDKAYTASGEFFRRPLLLVNDASISLIPEEFHRLIEVRTKIFYAEREDAPEIMTGSLAEYEDLLEKLESAELPDNHPNTMAAADQEDVYAEIP